MAVITCAMVFHAMAALSPAQVASITLGSGTGTPGEDVAIPLYLTTGGDQKWTRIVTLVEYPASLTYRRINASEVAVAAGVSVRATEPSPPAGSQKKRLEVRIEGGKGKAVPEGIMGSIFFHIDQEAKPQMFSLPLAEVKGLGQGSQQEVPLRGNPGSVAIYAPGTEPTGPSTLMGCFFFTH
jgi:hypothetical protein